MLTRQTIISIALLFALTAGIAHATDQTGWATNPNWQMLGSSWGVDDGVSWATLDGYGNPGTYGNEAVKVGDTVRFKFDMHKTLYGTHSFDALRAWIDLDGNGYSSADLNPGPGSDMIIQDQLDFNPGFYWYGTLYSSYSDTQSAYGWDPYKQQMGSLYYANVDVSFFTDVTFTETGYFELLARVMCSGDLGGDNPFGTDPDNWDHLAPWANIDTGPYAFGQGEVEKYTVHVVPLPAALLLFGSGLFSFGFFRRRSRATV